MEHLEKCGRVRTGGRAAKRDGRRIPTPLEVERQVVHEYVVADTCGALTQKLEVGLVVLKDAFRGRRLLRFLILLPWVAPVSIGSIGWKWILDSLYSVINWVLVRFHLVKPFSAPMWLGEPKLAMISVILVHTWHMLPFATVIILAGWTAIPRDIPEAAAVDGAGFFRRLFQIQIPMMLPIMNVAVLFGAIFTFTDMTVIYILTRGGPYDTTQVLPSMAFFTGILGGDLAEGAAISIFLVPLLVVVAWSMLRTAHRSEIA